MSPLLAILVSGLAMSLIALVGSVTLLLPETLLRRALRPLVGLAAGSLFGGGAFTGIAWFVVGMALLLAIRLLFAGP